MNSKVSHYLQLIKKNFYLLLLYPSMVLIIVYLTNNFLLPIQFSTNSQVIVSLKTEVNQNLDTLKTGIQLIPSFADVIQSKEIKDEVEKTLNRSVKEKLVVKTKEDSTLVTLALSGTDSQEIILVVDTFVKIISQKFPEIFKGSEIIVLQKATPAVKESNSFQYVLAIFIGGLAALAHVFYLFLIDSPKVFNKADMKEIGLSYLGELNYKKKNRKLLDKQLKAFSLNLLANTKNFDRSQVYIMTSVNEIECKSLATFYLAKHLAKMGYTTLLIDGNVENPKLTKKITGLKIQGLSEYIFGKTSTFTKILHQTKVKNLYFMTMGKSKQSLTKSAQEERLTKTFKLLRKTFDVVIIDTASILDGKTTYYLEKQANEVIIAVKSKTTEKSKVKQAKKIISSKNISTSGILIDIKNKKGV